MSSEFIGDIMNENPVTGITRLYFQNLNGLCWDSQGGKWPYICEVMDSIQADVACFAEINTDTNNYTIRRKMESICQRQFDQSRLVLSSSKHVSTSTYKPGGTAILACNALTSCIKAHTRDRMGRWTSISLATSPTKRIRIISAYQVCTNGQQGSNTAASQQRAQIIEEQSSGPYSHRSTPRQAFIQDLQAFIGQVQQEGEDIILVGDFNEEMTTPSSGMDQLATTCDLADLFSIKVGTATAPATYQRGPRRIDYALITPTLLHHVHAAGYDPFGYRIPTDHRGLYIDFSTDALFSHSLTPLAPAEKRDFLSTTPGTVCKYVTAKMKYLVDHKFFERMDVLNNLNLPDDNLAESLDRDFQRASQHAARMCSRRQQAPWSPQLAEAWAELHFYRLARSNLTVPANLIPAVQKLQTQCPHLPRELPIDCIQIRQGYNQALFKLKSARQAAKTLREEYLERKVALYAALEERGKAKAVQRLIRAESQQKVYTKIRYLRREENGAMGLSSLKIPKNLTSIDMDAMKMIPDTPDHWETVTVPEEIERLLLQRNRHHFSQAEGTPFTIPPLKADVGYKADGYTAELILAGQIDYTGATSATRLLIQHLQARTATTLDGHITMDDVREKLKNWKESTSTSPSGLHLGHYHCMWRDPKINPEEADRQAIVDGQTELLSCTVGLLNYALKFGYTFERWTKVVNIMLQKDPGNPRIHRLRVIHLYEADYNLLLAVKWRQAIHHAEDNKLLNDGLYGSRPGRSAHDPVFIEVLQNEIYRMSMKPGINFDLDAASCYDRILISLASISSRRVGVAKNVALVNATTLEQARYHLKTSLGVSTNYYCHSQVHPIHGTGQGSGNSPTIWCFVCSVLFDAYETQAHGATFTNYSNTSTMAMYMIGYVDDCAQRVNLFQADDQPTANRLIALMEKDSQLWNDLLWASGGALEQQKCSFSLIQTSWNRDGHPFLQGGTQRQNINLFHNGIITPTSQKSNYTSHKTLGCFVNPAHTNSKGWATIQHKNNKFANLLETNYFTRSEAWTYYTAFYLPSMTYPLQITPLSKSQCTQLDTRFLRSLIPRCGYNRNMSRAVRYATFTMGGAGFKQLYAEQGALLLQQVYKYLNSPQTQVGQLLQMTISWTQAFLGISRFFLTDVSQPIPPVGPSLLLDLRQFLHDIQGQIHLQMQVLSAPLRQNDRFIMDIALPQMMWTRRHLSQINACRRYLQAQTLADITNMAGTRLRPYVITGVSPPPFHSQRCAKFNQAKPGVEAWRSWRRFLLTISDKKGVLTNALGLWTAEHTQLRHWPEYVYDPIKDQLFSHVSGCNYRIHQRFKAGVFMMTFVSPPTNAHGYPTSVMSVAGLLRPAKNYTPSPPSTNDGHTPHSGIQTSLPPWEKELLQCYSLLCPLPELMHQLKTGNIISCSDGSSTKRGGTFGFIIATKQGQRLAKCHGPAPGAYSNSFRSEAYGVLATLRWLYRFSQSTPVNNNLTVSHHLDNKSVIKRIESARNAHSMSPNHRLKSEQDVIDEIKQTLDILPFQVNFRWIKGHQDAQKPLQELSLTAQLNCEADKEATSYASQHNFHQPTVTALPSTPCQLVIQKKSITSKIKRRVHEAATTPILFRYLQEKFQWDTTTTDMIDWDTFSNILKKYKGKWTTIVKHIHDISPTGHIAHRNNPHLPHECPACSTPQECNIHVIICPHRSRATWRTTTLQKVRHHKTSISDPYLIDILQDGLTRFHHQSDPIPQHTYPPRYSRLIQTQNAIGWDQLYKGRWSIDWSQSHHSYEKRVQHSPSTPQGKSWVLSIGRLLLDQWLAVWKIRNEERHGKNEILQQQIRHQTLTSELTELYSYKTKVCPADRTIFHESVEEHLAKHPSLEVLSDWIAIHKDAIKASANQAATLGITKNRTLLDYPTYNPIIQAGT